MAKLAEVLMGIRNGGKVPNQKVAKSQNVLLIPVLVLILVLDESLRSHNSVTIVGFTFKITPMNCTYSSVAPFR